MSYSYDKLEMSADDFLNKFLSYVKLSDDEREEINNKFKKMNKIVKEILVRNHFPRMIKEIKEIKIEKRFKFRIYGKKTKSVLGDQCNICIDEYKSREHIIELDCGHDYHKICIKKWLNCNNNCPMCRRVNI